MGVATVLAVEVKGWRHGLVIVIPPDGEWNEVIERVHEKLDEARARSFWRGSQTTFDCGSRNVTADELKALADRVRRGFGLIPASVLSLQAETRTVAEAMGLEVYEELPTFKKPARENGAEAEPEKPIEKPAEKPVEKPAEVPAPEPVRAALPINNALYLVGTVRSGQRITHDTHVVICGDVNAGAEVMAGGDVVVIGTLRGLAHAGCYGDENARIVAGSLRPPQLRIATKIARSPEESDSKNHSTRPEVAKIVGGEIGVFPL